MALVASEFMKRNRSLILVAGLAFLVRLIYLLELSNNPGFENPMIDEKWHWEWALDILKGPFFGDGSYFRAPLYPYFLAFLSWLTGGSIFWSKLLQLLLTIGTTSFIYLTAERLFNRRAAIFAGLLYAIYGTFLYYDAMFLIEVLFVFLLTWGMYRLIAKDNPQVGSAILTGFIFGLAAIARPNILMVIPVLIVWLWFAFKRKLSYRASTFRALALGAGVAIAVLPVTVRNVIVTGEWILISSQGGVNLYLGNNPQANGLNMLMPEVVLDETVSWRDFIPVTTQAAEREAGRRLTDSEVSGFWTGKAVDFMVDHPGDFLSLVGKKLVYLAMGFENSDNLDVYYQRSMSHLYSLLLWQAAGSFYFPFGLLLPLAVMGMVVTAREWRRLLPIYLFMLAYVPTIILFLVTARHRLPILPFLMVLAAGGIACFASEWRRLSAFAKAASVILPVILFVVLNRTYFDAGKSNDFQNYFNDGLRYANIGDYGNAETAYTKAYAINSQSVPLLDNLAFAQFQQGKTAQAQTNFEQAIALNPYYARTYNNLGLLMLKIGRPDSAAALFARAASEFADESVTEPVLSQVYLNMADAYEALGDTATAFSSHQRAMDIAPQFGRAYFEAGAFFARMERFDLVDTSFERGMRFGDPRPVDHFNWGLSLIRRQKFNEAISQMRLALERDAAFYQAAFCIAASYHDLGAATDSSRKYVNMALEYNPQYAPAIRLLNALNAPSSR